MAGKIEFQCNVNLSLNSAFGKFIYLFILFLFSLYLTLTKYRKQKIHAYNNIKTYNEVFLAYQRYAN